MRFQSQLLGLLLLTPLTGCGGHSKMQPVPVATHPAGSCPVIRDSDASDKRFRSARADSAPLSRIRDGPRHVGYVSVLIDGQWAQWNDDGSGPALGPDLKPDDVDRVEIVKGPAAQQRYGTCPGVGLIIFTTKSKTWRPYSHESH
jgi:hypothetical protein